MIVQIYFRSGKSDIFQNITALHKDDDLRLVLKRGGEIIGEFYIANIAGYQKRPDIGRDTINYDKLDAGLC